jgi:hypothetical protein
MFRDQPTLLIDQRSEHLVVFGWWPGLLSPEVLEPARRQLGVSHRVLDIAVAEVGLQRSRIVALVGQCKTTGVAQHVRMSRKAAFPPRIKLSFRLQLLQCSPILERLLLQ